MKKYVLFAMAIIVLAVGCGGDQKTPDNGNQTDNNGTSEERPDKKDGMVLIKTPEGSSFYVPEGWKSVVFKFPPSIIDEIDEKNPARIPVNLTDRVEAGAETVFYPPDMDFAKLEEKLATRDFRYVKDLEINDTIIIYMQGATTKYFPDACKNYSQVTFYDDGDSDYQSFTIPFSKDIDTEACWATLKPPALKFNGQAYVYVAYGQKTASSSQPITQFSGLAVVGESLSGEDRELFENIAKSFKF